MLHHELFIARIALDRHREMIGSAEHARKSRSARAHRAPHARRQIAAWLIGWAHRLDPDVGRAQRSPHATA